MQDVSLFFMYVNFGGGTTNFTAHLYEGLTRAGYKPRIYRVKEQGETFQRKFAKFDGIKFQNIGPRQAFEIIAGTPSIMTAPCNAKYLPWNPDLIEAMIEEGMRVVVHDPSELEIYEGMRFTKRKPPFCVRPSMRRIIHDAVFIPHPYVRTFHDEKYVPRKRELHAISVSRITFVKRTDMIIEANQKLPEKKRVVLRGQENRLFTRYKVIPKFPDFKQGGYGFPLTWGSSARECARAHYAVDLTYFDRDGGGSQYSFMDAWDAGTVNILHADWLRYKGEMAGGVNCIPIHDAQHLSEVLRVPLGNVDLESMVNAGYKALQKHDPAKVARQYMREFGL